MNSHNKQAKEMNNDKLIVFSVAAIIIAAPLALTLILQRDMPPKPPEYVCVANYETLQRFVGRQDEVFMTDDERRRQARTPTDDNQRWCARFDAAHHRIYIKGA